MGYLDQINLNALKHKAQADLDKARLDIVEHIVRNSHEVYGGPAYIDGRKISHLDLQYDRLNVIFNDGTHLTVHSDQGHDGNELEFISMWQDDAIRLGLVPDSLLKELNEKKEAVDFVLEEEKHSKELAKLVDKMGKDTILKLLGA